MRQAADDRLALGILAALAVYVALHAALRVGIAAPLNLDEAEALLWASRLDWGYGPQPPAYVWIQAGVQALLGPTVLSVATQKALLVFATLAAVVALAARWHGAGVAALAALGLLWIPEFGWESQRIRTHNVLATLLAVLAVLQVLRWRQSPVPGRALVLGLVWGAGLLAKWNFALVPLASTLALLWPVGAGRTVPPRAGLALAWAVALVLVLPTLAWMRGHPDVAFASAGKLGIEAAPGLAEGAARFVASGLRAGFSLAAVPGLVLLVLLLVARRGRAVPPPLSAGAAGERAVVGRILWLTLALVLAGGLASGATVVVARWLLPLFVVALPLLAAPVIARLGPVARRGFVVATAVLGLAYLAGMAQVLLDQGRVRAVDHVALAAALDPAGAPVVAEVVMAANLALVRPDLDLLDPPLLAVRPCPAAALLLSGGDMTLARAHLLACGLVPGPESPLADLPGAPAVIRFVPAPQG